MFGIGMPELAMILVVALIVLGPKRLPEVARQIGKAMGELRRHTDDVMHEFQAATREDEAAARDRRRAAQQKAREAAAAAGAEAAAVEKEPSSDSGNESA